MSIYITSGVVVWYNQKCRNNLITYPGISLSYSRASVEKTDQG